MRDKRYPLKILHVVGGMNPGGIETWLMHILRNIDRDRFQMDFLVHTIHPCAYDDEIRTLGSEIIPCPDPSLFWWTYDSNFTRILEKHGQYDIVHSHVHHFSGNVLRLAKQADISVRIAHCHTDKSSLRAKAGWKRRFYLALMEWWIVRYANLGFACSREAAVDLFGSLWECDSRWQVLYCGIDLNPFREKVDPVAVRNQLGIPADAFVMGHVGRFNLPKNHKFLLQIAAEIAKYEPKMRLLLIGDGSLRQDIEQLTAKLGLSGLVIFAGLRSDVSQLMLGAMDVFLFPSLYEGLGLALVEAQAAGLPCIVSDTVPEEADVVKPLVQRLSLSQPPSWWRKIILSQRQKSNRAIACSEALSVVTNSQFNLDRSLKQLETIYQARSRGKI